MDSRRARRSSVVSPSHRQLLLYKSRADPMRQRAGAWQLQEPAGGRRCLLPIKELFGGPTGLSLASRPGTQSCAALLHRLLALRPAGQRMASQRRKRRGPTVQRLLRQLQAIRVGTLKIAGQDSKRLLTQIPPELNTLLGRLGLLPLFAQPPAWAEV
jgi:hypothetical protein